MQTLKEVYDKTKNGENKLLLADIISLLSMTNAPVAGEIPESLKYRLLGSKEDIGNWGHEYVRNLAAEIGTEYHRRIEQDGDKASMEDLMGLVHEIVPFHMQHNAEPEAVDLLLEVEKLDILLDNVNDANYSRTCLYLFLSLIHI